MSLAGYYKRQFSWRDWPSALAALPPLRGQTVLDLGCGVGDLAAELAARGARVIGFDINEELLREAQSRQLPDAEFRMGDLRALPDIGVKVDGLWASFAAAYFPDLPATLAGWGEHLRAGGWIALTEIDGMFGHEPLSEHSKSFFDAYADDAFAAGRYDFHMGHKLPGHLERCGFTVSKVLTLQDQELSFRGPALPEVVEAWGTRLDGMKLLRDRCGASFARVREEFLGCLSSPSHSSTAKVYCCIAEKQAGVVAMRGSQDLMAKQAKGAREAGTKLVDDLVSAWNLGDAPAFASLFAIDADYVTGAGIWLHGRPAIAELLRTATSHPRIRVEGDVAVRESGNMGSLIFRWVTEAGEKPPRRGVVTCVVVKSGTGWLIDRLHNTDQT